MGCIMGLASRRPESRLAVPGQHAGRKLLLTWVLRRRAPTLRIGAANSCGSSAAPPQSLGTWGTKREARAGSPPALPLTLARGVGLVRYSLSLVRCLLLADRARTPCSKESCAMALLHGFLSSVG